MVVCDKSDCVCDKSDCVCDRCYHCIVCVQPKYILQLMKAAEQRKREQEIIFERKQKKEIDREKELYGEKDAFVTPSYLKLLEERKAEEERLRKEEEREGG